MSNDMILDLVREAVTPGATVLVASAEPARIASLAHELAGSDGSVCIACFDPEDVELTRDQVSTDIGVFRAAPVELSTDVEILENELTDNPPETLAQIDEVIGRRRKQAAESPLVTTDSVNVLIAENVLGLARSSERANALAEFYRVVKRHGVLILTDSVSDEPLPERLADDLEMPAVFQESELLTALEDAAFHGVAIRALPESDCDPFEGIECRQITVTAHKGKEGVCRDGLQAVIYLGPFKTVEDDDGHIIRRGERFAVCQKTFRNYQLPPYTGMFTYLEPPTPIAPEDAPLWDPNHPSTRSPSETKGLTAPARVAATSVPSGHGLDGPAYVAQALWLGRDGSLIRRAKVSHRYDGYFTDQEAALAMARKLFSDASRHETVRLTQQEAARLRNRAARRPVSCDLPRKT